MALSEAEHPVNKIVPLPLSTIPGRTFNSRYQYQFQEFKYKKFYVFFSLEMLCGYIVN